MNPILETQTIESFIKEFKGHDCQLCPLSKSRSQIVVSRGSPHAKIMFIGRDPGRDEDLTGFPFVGKAGQYLQETIDKLGLDLDRDFYITNTCRCRPENNKLPGAKETRRLMNSCKPYLLHEIKLLQPKLIITLGKEAFANIYKNFNLECASIGRYINQIYPSDLAQYGVLCMYHPAYIVRDLARLHPVFVSHFVQHLKLIKEIISSVKQ